MTRRPRPPFPWTATLAGVLAACLLMLLVQVPRQAVAMLAAEMVQAMADGAMCVHETGVHGGEEGKPSDAPDARHDHAPCLACQVCCTLPAALPAADAELPRPWLSALLRSNPSRPLPRRRPRGRRANARAPPRSSPPASASTT
ncbi:DUF2946 family protein [Azospirillum sp. sgz302134]